jgi:hypothetical protein
MDNKDEFNYHAVSLIFGKKSPRIVDFQAFVFDILRKHPEIKYSEMSGLTPDNVLDINRELRIHDTRRFVSNNCKMSSGTCRIITFVDAIHRIHMSDSLFSVGEYEYFSRTWDKVVKNKVRTFGMLIRSVYEGKLFDIPLLINEFPNITKVLLSHPDIWVKEEANEKDS